MKPTAGEDGQGQGRRRRPTDAAVQAARAAAPMPARLGRLLQQQAHRLASLRFWAVAAGHLAVFALVFWLAMLLRSDFVLPLPRDEAAKFWAWLPWIVAIKFSVFFLLGHYDGWWAYVTFGDLIALIRTSLVAMLCIITVNYLGGSHVFLRAGVRVLPVGVPFLDCGLTVALLGALRGSWRLYREQFWPMFNQSHARWALLVGTDHSHGVLAHQIQSYGELPYRILQASGRQITGYNRILYWDEVNAKSYKFIDPKIYACGASQCFWKTWWEKHPYLGKQTGEDQKMAWTAAKLGQLDCEDGGQMLVARVHPGNTWKPPLGGPMFPECDRAEFPVEFFAAI
ncbi:MAG: hypothetical protein ACLQLG_15875 [Thermoguttaceae bacterium]